MKNIIFIILAISLLVTKIAFADWQKPNIQYSNTYHCDIREGDKDYYTQKLKTIFSYKDVNGKDLIKISPFFEFRRNTERDLWEREEAGIEIGRELIKGIYFGQTIQGTRYKEDFQHYQKIDKSNYLEAVSKLYLSYGLFKSDRFNLIGFILDEYTFNIDKQSGWRNEVSIGLTIPIVKWLKTGINWNHIDRIHYFDSDAFEVSVNLIF